jgi:hypothetical protein
MMNREEYKPGPARGARAERKDGEKWTLVLVRELHHPPAKVWEAITDPAHLREWAPYEVEGSLAQPGTVNLTWVGTPTALPTTVTRVEPPHVLEYGDMRWNLETMPDGTRLTLWADIDKRFITWGAAGWHISFDVLDRLLGGTPIGRIAGSDAIKSADWKRLTVEYATQFGIQPHH